MLRTNLATRPFYNQRAVRFAIGAALLALVGLTAGNIAAFSHLSERERALGGDVRQAEARALELQQQTRRLRQGLNTEQVESITAAATEANGLIDRRVFSWIDLLGEFERTLPDDVRIVSIAPETDKEGRLVIVVAVLARSAEDVDTFRSALASGSRFTDVVPMRERTNEQGMLEVTLQGRLAGLAVRGATAPAQGR
jgi:hypothetical protein